MATGRLLPFAALAAALLLAGCARQDRPLNEPEKVVQAVLRLLAQGGKPVCADDQTEGHALAVFREMTLAPRAARADLRWHPPTPLSPTHRWSVRDLRQTELGNEQIRIAAPRSRTDVLPGLEQFQLDGAARRLMRPVGGNQPSVAITGAMSPPNVITRWWPLNRVRQDCWPVFILSDPRVDRHEAFLTVRAEHWGALYALRRANGDWRVVAEWSNWIY